MPSCAAFGCNNRTNEGGISFHKFPKNEELREKWIIAVKRDNWAPGKFSTICSAHFRKEDLDLTSLCRVRLREEAVPCIFPTIPEKMEMTTIKQECLEDETNCDIDLKLVKEESCSIDDMHEQELTTAEETEESNVNEGPEPADIHFIKCEPGLGIDWNEDEVDPLSLTHGQNMNITNESSSTVTDVTSSADLIIPEVFQNMPKEEDSESICSDHLESLSDYYNSDASVDNNVDEKQEGSDTYSTSIGCYLNTSVIKKMHKCEECDYSTAKKSHLAMHMRIHSGVRPYKCLSCSYSSAQKSNLRVHMKIHTKEKPFKCEHCNYSASAKSHLQLHTRIHSGERPYKCSRCDYSAIDKPRLVEHTRTHSGEKPYKCSQCSYSSAHKTNIVRHLTTHSSEKPYKCSKCDYSAAYKLNLTRHLITHAGKKMYKCSQCNYSAIRKPSLVLHMRTHSGEKPFVCSLCSYSAAQKRNLVKHMRTHVNQLNV